MSTQPDVSPITSEEVATFDAGLLNDFGGGNVDWWQDYVRSLLEQSDEHYRQYIEAKERAYLALSERVGELERENRRAWTERNVAYAKVKGWEAAVYVEGLPLRAVSVDEWGPGEGGQTIVPDITPKRLVDLLDELTRHRAALTTETDNG